MGSKRNISFDKRLLVIFHNVTGKSNGEIAALFNIWKSTVNDIANRSKREDCIESGRILGS